jgi:hypothetical protein
MQWGIDYRGKLAAHVGWDTGIIKGRRWDRWLGVVPSGLDVSLISSPLVPLLLLCCFMLQVLTFIIPFRVYW